MFDQLKREFVKINMTLLTVVFVLIFSVIYLLTAVSGEHQTELALEGAMYSPAHQRPNKPAMASSITVELDSQGRITRINTAVAFGEEIIEAAALDAYAHDKMSAHITIGDSNYAFLKQTEDFGTKIVFIDRTPQQKALNNLLIIFFGVGGLSLGVLYLISLYFANRAIAPIREMFEKQKQFIADASHELRTPLTVIKTNTSLIMSNRDERVASQLKWLEYISFQVDRMSELVNDMLSLARYDYVGEPSVTADLDLSKTLGGNLLSFEAVLYENNVELETEIQSDVIMRGNLESIKRLINILMDNAVKNTPARGKISVALREDKHGIVLLVNNSGAGIQEEHIEKIFERFYRVDDSRSRASGGYGLGLAIAKSIVEQHRGRILAQSRTGIDTTFIVELPHTNK